MDLVTTLRQKLAALEESGRLAGLRDLLSHLEAAEKYLDRGLSQNEPAAFADAILRVNQAFELGLKEAYRVYVGREPAYQRVCDIEKLFEQNRILPTRVAARLIDHERLGRKPIVSGSDPMWSESDAFLALVAGASMACVLMDGIAQQVSFTSARTFLHQHRAWLQTMLPQESGALADRCVALFQAFSVIFPGVVSSAAAAPRLPLIGSLRGFIATAASDLEIAGHLDGDQCGLRETELLVASAHERQVVRLISTADLSQLSAAAAQLAHCATANEASGAIIFVVPPDPGELQCVTRMLPDSGAPLLILTPFEAPPSSVRPRPSPANWYESDWRCKQRAPIAPRWVR